MMIWISKASSVCHCRWQLNSELLVMSVFRHVGVGAVPAGTCHITKTRSVSAISKFLFLSWQIAIWTMLFGFVVATSTTAQAIPRPAMCTQAGLNSRKDRRLAQRVNLRASRCGTGSFYSTNEGRSCAKREMVLKDASRPCYHFFAVPASSNPARTAVFVSSYSRSLACRFACHLAYFIRFALSVLLGGVVGVLIWLGVRSCLRMADSAVASEFGQAGLHLAQTSILLLNRSHRFWGSGCEASASLLHLGLESTRSVRMWIVLPLRDMGATVLGMCICFLANAAVYVIAVYCSGWIPTRQTNSTVKLCPRDTRAAAGNHDHHLCSQCFRANPDFDTWFGSYLASRGLSLRDLGSLDDVTRRDIYRLAYLHGSTSLLNQLPSPSPEQLLDTRSTHRVRSQQGPLYSAVKLELSLHCQCRHRVDRCCGGHLYSAGWDHPSGEEVSGMETGEEDRGEEDPRASQPSSLNSATVSLRSSQQQDNGHPMEDEVSPPPSEFR